MIAPANLETIRCFVAIPLDAAVIEDLQERQRGLRTQLADASVQWAQPQQIHLTLKFLGNVRAASVEEMISTLREACGGIAPFDLATGGLGCFPSASNPRIVWLGLAGETDRLLQLQQRVAEAMAPFSERNETRPFHPHLTIGRVKRACPDTAKIVQRLMRESAASPPRSWRVTEVVLMRSVRNTSGAVYSKLGSVNLAG